MRTEYVTKTKSLILEFVTRQGREQFAAPAVYQYLLQQGCKVNLATVYRILE